MLFLQPVDIILYVHGQLYIVSITISRPSYAIKNSLKYLLHLMCGFVDFFVVVKCNGLTRNTSNYFGCVLDMLII